MVHHSRVRTGPEDTGESPAPADRGDSSGPAPASRSFEPHRSADEGSEFLPSDPERAPSVLVLGGHFAGRGAEAMLLTVVRTIRVRFPQARILVPVSRAAPASRLFPIGCTPLLTRAPGTIGKLADTAGAAVRRRRPAPLALSSLPGGAVSDPYRYSHLVVDISGFASGDAWGPMSAIGRWRQIRTAAAAGNRIVFLPQSWGPFRHPVTARFTRWMIEDADLCFAREPRGYENLIGLGLRRSDRIRRSPDIAFRFHGEASETGRALLRESGCSLEKAIVGLTPNMQIYQRTGGDGDANAYVQMLVRTMEQLLERDGLEIVLIPHETRSDRPDDRTLCDRLGARFTETGRVHRLGGEPTAAEIKSVIGGLALLIASRYHSLVAALSLRVPVVVAGWADKYDALMERAGVSRWVVDPVRDPGGASSDRLADAWDERSEIAHAIQANVPAIEAEADQALEALESLLEDVSVRS